MVEKEPINVQEILARKKRLKFHATTAVFFVICCVLAFWILPRFAAMAQEVGKEVGGSRPAAVSLMLSLAEWFKILWVFILIGLSVLNVMVWRGYFDNMLPLLNLAILLAGLAAVGLAFYAFYLPTLSLLHGK